MQSIENVYISQHRGSKKCTNEEYFHLPSAVCQRNWTHMPSRSTRQVLKDYKGQQQAQGVQLGKYGGQFMPAPVNVE